MNPSAHFAGRDVVRWGIIGCGDVTEVKSGPGFQAADGSMLVAVMRRNGRLAADYARRHCVPRWYDDADRLISDPQVDAVYIATPPGTHCEYALRVAAAEKPAYIEKPMARSSSECDRMVQGFAAAKLPLYVAYYRRRLPRFLDVADRIRDGSLGTITGVDYRLGMPRHRLVAGWRFDSALSGGGIFLDMGSHALDLLDFLLGPLREISGCASNLASACDVEDTVALCFRSAAGIPGCVICDFASAVAVDELCIRGTEGSATLSVFGSEPVRLQTPSGPSTLDLPNPPTVQQPLIQSVVDDLLGKGVCPSTGQSARRCSQVMDAVLSSYYGGRDDPFWTRPKTWPGRREFAAQ